MIHNIKAVGVGMPETGQSDTRNLSRGWTRKNPTWHLWCCHPARCLINSHPREHKTHTQSGASPPKWALKKKYHVGEKRWLCGDGACCTRTRGDSQLSVRSQAGRGGLGGETQLLSLWSFASQTLRSPCLGISPRRLLVPILHIEGSEKPGSPPAVLKVGIVDSLCRVEPLCQQP